jgi:hypothetical protein
MSKYKWQLICKDSQTDESGEWYGHSFWRDTISGRVSLCDMSGDRPDQTDDGVLWIDMDRPWLVEDGDRVTIPLLVARDEEEPSCSSTLWHDGITIAAKLGCAVRISKDSKISKTIKLLRGLSIE